MKSKLKKAIKLVEAVTGKKVVLKEETHFGLSEDEYNELYDDMETSHYDGKSVHSTISNLISDYDLEDEAEGVVNLVTDYYDKRAKGLEEDRVSDAKFLVYDILGYDGDTGNYNDKMSFEEFYEEYVEHIYWEDYEPLSEKEMKPIFDEYREKIRNTGKQELVVNGKINYDNPSHFEY